MQNMGENAIISVLFGIKDKGRQSRIDRQERQGLHEANKVKEG